MHLQQLRLQCLIIAKEMTSSPDEAIAIAERLLVFVLAAQPST